MINYILQVMLFQLAFLAIYDVFLKKETFFTGNRIYLLSTPLLSFLIPFVKISSFQTGYTSEVSILLPEIVLSPQSVIESSPVIQSMDINYAAIIFWIGFAFFLSLFLFKLIKLNSIVRKSKIQLYKDFKLVTIARTRKAFSFFNYIFLGEEISEDDKRKIIKHEIVHSRQKHSFDLLVFELLKIVMWFNPLNHVFQKRIATVHEFISDSYVVKTTEKEQYVNTLLNELFEVDNFSFINQFANKSMLKKRIVMMTKEKSKQIMQAKYLLLLPLFMGMLFYISCSEEFQNIESIIASKRPQTTYLYSKDGLKEMTRGTQRKDSYLDFLIAFTKNEVPHGWKEISKADLSNEEQIEYDDILKRFEKLDLKENSVGMEYTYKLFRDENERGVLGMMPKFDLTNRIRSFSKMTNGDEVETITEDIPFTIIDKIPTFPGCGENDKNCFNRKMQQHFVANFNKELPNQLKLSSGKKRLITLFVIDKNGNIRDVKVKAPHKKLEEEAKRVIGQLPQMIPGENKGEKWSVKYTLPIRIDVK